MGHSNKDDDVAIRVSHVKKDFYLPHEKRSRSFKSAIISAFKKRDKGANTQHALKDISFEIKKGEFFGIVGRNGSGKSTLLKIIAQIYQPTKGKVEHFGKIVPFIELGVGFNPELSGRENVYLNGALLGFTREEIDAKYDDIVGFAELEDFMDQKLKNYSSGMQVRLAFSIAIQADGDILLLDEVLAVGDEAFQRKCNDYFKQLKDDNKTVILVTHSMENVRKYCHRAILIKDGLITIDGSPEDIANKYSLENLGKSVPHDKKEEKETPIKELKVELQSPRQVTQSDKVIIKYSVLSDRDITAGVVMDLYNLDENYYLYCFGSPQRELKAGQRAYFESEFDISQFNNMNVTVHSSVRNKEGDLLAYTSDAESPNFIIRRTDYKDNSIPQAGTIFKNGKNARWQ